MGREEILRGIRNLFKKKSLLTIKQQGCVDEKTILEAEKELKELKKEEDEARARVIKGLNDIFNDLPHLL